MLTHVCPCVCARARTVYVRTESYLRPWIIEFPSVRLDFSTTTRARLRSFLKINAHDDPVIVASTPPGVVYNVSRPREVYIVQCIQGDSGVRGVVSGIIEIVS